MDKTSKDLIKLYESKIVNEVSLSPGLVKRGIDLLHGAGKGKPGVLPRRSIIKKIGKEYKIFNLFNNLKPRFDALFSNLNKARSTKNIQAAEKAINDEINSILSNPEFIKTGIDPRMITRIYTEKSADSIARAIRPSLDNIANILSEKSGGYVPADWKNVLLEPSKQMAINRAKEMLPLLSNISVTARYSLMVLITLSFIASVTTIAASWVPAIVYTGQAASTIGQGISEGAEGFADLAKEGLELIRLIKSLFGYTTPGQDEEPDGGQDSGQGRFTY